MHSIGIDTGGTFTDAVIPGSGGYRVHKVPSTPEDPSRAIEGVLGDAGAVAWDVRHGTTVATNAVLTRGGARVCLVGDRGFEDLLHIGRGTRASLFSLHPERHAPLIEGDAVVGVNREGAALDGRGRSSLLRRVKQRRPEAIAIARLHALEDPQCELGLRDVLRELGLPISCSAALSVDGREFERASTAVLNAYVQPLMSRYLGRLAGLEGCDRLSVLRSDGGRMPAEQAVVAPVRTSLSGPAAGVAAVQALLRRQGLSHGMSFDVGGTSTDVAWVEADDLPVRPTLRVGVHAASIPSVGIETIGAGGGSRIDVDLGGALTVGPASAGADPGPACYGRGGPMTLTDAWLLTGRLPTHLAGGRFSLDAGAARVAARALAKRAGMSMRALCEGATAVAAMHAARALRHVAITQGRDPRDACLVAFGGAGPQLACETAERLGIQVVLVPPAPGVMAALGAWQAPQRAIREQRLGPRDGGRLARIAKSMERAIATDELAGADAIAARAEVEGRYPGQVGTLAVPLAAWPAAFHARHEGVHGFARPDTRPEAVVLRVRAREGEERSPGTPIVQAHMSDARAAARRHLVHEAPAHVARSRVGSKRGRRGALRIDEDSGTTWVPAGWRARAGRDDVLWLERVR